MSLKTKKAVVAGQICLDITPELRGGGQHFLDKLSPGKMLLADGVDIHTGGLVANTGLAMRIFGIDARLIARVGDDELADMISSIFDQYGVKDDLIRDQRGSTAYSVVLAPKGVDRIFILGRGVNEFFCADDVPDEVLEGAALLHFGYPSSLRTMYENDGEEIVRLLLRARAAGAAVSMDLAAVDPEGEAAKQDWKTILQRVLPLVDFFLPSAEEICFILNRPLYDEWQERAGRNDVTAVLDPEKDIRPLAETCLAYGAKAVVIKCGAPGFYYKTGSLEKIREMPAGLELDPAAWADLEGFERSFVPDRICAGTGAGDTSNGAFLAAILKGYGPEDVLQLTSAAGASCVTSFDALGGLMPLEELKRKIDAGWKKSNQ